MKLGERGDVLEGESLLRGSFLHHRDSCVSSYREGEEKIETLFKTVGRGYQSSSKNLRGTEGGQHPDTTHYRISKGRKLLLSIN